MAPAKNRGGAPRRAKLASKVAVTIRLTVEERAALRRVARERGRTVSELVRSALVSIGALR